MCQAWSQALGVQQVLALLTLFLGQQCVCRVWGGSLVSSPPPLKDMGQLWRSKCDPLSVVTIQHHSYSSSHSCSRVNMAKELSGENGNNRVSKGLEGVLNLPLGHSIRTQLNLGEEPPGLPH